MSGKLFRRCRCRWFWLDDNPGLETLYIVASYRPMQGLEALLRQMEQAGGAKAAADRVREAIHAAKRPGVEAAPKDLRIRPGLSAVVKKRPFQVRPPNKQQLDRIGEAVRGTFRLVKQIRIRHE